MGIVIYTTDTCPYCDQAKKLFKRKNVMYQEHDVSNNPTRRQALIEKSNGLRTVPQIFIDGQHIGGYDALSKLDMQGKLDELIKPHIVAQ